MSTLLSSFVGTA
ncbi:hypothetical protein CP082626L3_0587A, partial [Chlamydia psittaci 08-2626_L3]